MDEPRPHDKPPAASRPLHLAAACVAFAIGACAPRPVIPPRPERLVPVIPAPHVAQPARGEWKPADTVDVWLADTTDTEFAAVGELATDIVRQWLGRPVLLVAGRRARERPVILKRLENAQPEAYTLSVAPEGVEIAASAGAGLFYGVQTLRQLLEDNANRPGTVAGASRPAPPVPGVTIVDRPRFPYRGLHLDVARHFMPVEFVKRYIDLMARYKLNRFHWHLTDDQGWRIEIRRHPRLTSIGGCRKETMVAKNFQPYVGDGTPHCGFYTQEEIRDVVAYAAARYVTIVPEIEMPGHAKAALAAYPELACTPGPFEVRTTWGVDEDVFCPGEETFAFIEDVLTEVMALFPGRYIHIGGDEVPKTRWKASPVAQAVMQRSGLRDENELQSWFVRRVERFLVSHGRRLIGWDEILEGGLAPEATVMSWRGTSGGIAAAREGHDVIMTPNSHLYFDHYQGDSRFEPLAIGGLSTIEKVYAYEPVPDTLAAVEAGHILGAQANLWTEYLKGPADVEFMVWPRALALAEVAWSTREARDWENFATRLPTALRTLGDLGVNYRVPHVEGLEADRLTLDRRVRVRLATLQSDAEIRYTTDGSDPTPASTRYRGPFSLPVNGEGVTVTARAFMPNGRSSPPRAARFTRTTYRAAERDRVVEQGLRYEYFEASLREARALDSLAAVREGTARAVGLRGDERAGPFAVRLSGYVVVPTDDLYEFALTSDDGSSLEIGGRLVVDNDGLHGPQERLGMIALRRGLHPLVVRFFQGGGGATLSLRYRTAQDAVWAPVPESWFAHAPARGGDEKGAGAEPPPR